MMEKRDLQRGDVVQINPANHQSFFAGILMFVKEPTPFGAIVYCFTRSDERGEMPNRKAVYRARFEEMEYVGRAAFDV